MRVGDILFHDGDEHRRTFVVGSGWLKTTRTLSDGQLQIVGLPTRGSTQCVESPLDYANDCEGLTPADVHSFPVGTILQLCEEPRFADNLLRQAGAQLAVAQTQLVTVGRQSAAQKAAVFLASLADAWDARDGDEFILPMLRSDIGDFLGLR